MSFRHIVLTKLHDDVDDATRAQVVQLLTSLGKEPDVLYSKVNESIDARKGYVIITDAAFVDQAASESFKSSEAHTKAGEFVRDAADWWVGDYLED